MWFLVENFLFKIQFPIRSQSLVETITTACTYNTLRIRIHTTYERARVQALCVCVCVSNII